MSAPGADTALVTEAAQWLLRLRDDETRDDDDARSRTGAAFAAWKSADPRHAAAALKMESLLECVQELRELPNGSTRPMQTALSAAMAAKPRRHRKRTVTTVTVLMLSLVTAVALLTWPPANLMADLRNGPSQHQDFRLADGTHVEMRGAGAVNVRYDAAQRTLELVEGDILVDVARDASRPFVVETAHGRIRALGTRFLVERRSDATVLTMLESTTEVRPAAGSAQIPVRAGERLRFTAAHAEPITPLDAVQADNAWRKHLLVLDDQALPDVLDALARQRPGFVQYDRAAIANIRVSAVLPLDDTDRALQLLVDNFPQLRVRTFSRYLVMVSATPRP